MAERPHTILVADDEEDFRIVLADHFEDRGYEVVAAADGQEALELFDREPRRFDLVLTDIRMPRLSGEELIAELRKRRRHLPIIGVTGHADLSGRLKLFDQGAYYYLDKPLPQWPIVDRLVENAIRLHRTEEEIEKRRAKENEIARLLRAYLMKATSDEIATARGGDGALGLDIHMWYVENDRPAGDYVEWFKRGESEIVFYVADASGHDDLLSSFMATLASQVLHRNHHGRVPSVDGLILAMDGALGALRGAGALGHERYLTFFLGVIDLVTGRLSYVNAGHPEAFLYRPADGGVDHRRLISNSRPVGFLFDQPPEVGTVELQPGDVLFVYTDGATDLLEQGVSGARPQGFGIDLLASEVERTIASPAHEIVARVARYLEERAGATGFPDDTTLLAIKIGGEPGR